MRTAVARLQDRTGVMMLAILTGFRDVNQALELPPPPASPPPCPTWVARKSGWDAVARCIQWSACDDGSAVEGGDGQDVSGICARLRCLCTSLSPPWCCCTCCVYSHAVRSLGGQPWRLAATVWRMHLQCIAMWRAHVKQTECLSRSLALSLSRARARSLSACCRGLCRAQPRDVHGCLQTRACTL